MGGLLLAATAVWDCCDGDVARLKFMESDFGEKLDTACDNIINVFYLCRVNVWNGSFTRPGPGDDSFSYARSGRKLDFFTLFYFPKGGKGFVF